MNGVKSLLAAGLLVCVSSHVQAQAIESVTMTSDPNDVVFTVRADKALSMPSMRAYDGQIRVRFPSADAPQSIQVNGDGAAIKLIDVRGGSHDSAVMRLELGDGTKLGVDDVRVENRKHIMVLRIARDLLPPLREPRVEEPAKKLLPANNPVPAPALAPVSPEKKGAAPLALSAAKSASPADVKKAEPLKNVMAGPSASSPMPMLLGISAILALAYGVMRLLTKKKLPGDKLRAPIDIVAQKRIGPRHQLVIVRAFGREHLLSIQGGNTTLIAASEEIEDTFGDKLALVSQESALTPDPQMIQNVAISQKSEPARESRVETLTGGDLIRSAIQQRLSSAASKKSASEEMITAARANAEAQGSRKEEKALSQAVAGLVRLRREAQL